MRNERHKETRHESAATGGEVVTREWTDSGYAFFGSWVESAANSGEFFQTEYSIAGADDMDYAKYNHQDLSLFEQLQFEAHDPNCD